ncbi:MAG: hypothetical protein JO171_18465 [Paludibacterium sp.]|uniref:hypothetical protein n=1 Tax=Paludibacterium sp. TaxID=1917523 RepID=UPI0025F56FA7|nr:hypothetical protein [Paludibacterium sp.]MBV8049138.1 hypothetical protein [Paludibacterium sp.]MBV8646975.1 hypothetical protein [Paludibacterium sp.]
MRIRNGRSVFVLLTLCLLGWLSSASALPAFARQTGEACEACHISFPELTPFGRLFKLSGYTLGTTQLFPVSAMAIVSDTRASNTGGNPAFSRNGEPTIEAGSIFAAGRISDHLGLFSQWTYNNITPSTNADGSTRYTGSFAVDNNDIRVVDHIAKQDLDLIYGVSLNNNPTVQDVWNTTPAFGYPYQTSGLAGTWGTSTQYTPLLNGALAHQVAGLSAYAFLNKHWYLELGNYQAAEGLYGILSHDVTISNRLEGTNPYWRFAWNNDWGPHSLSVGTFGMQAHVNTDPTQSGSPTNRYLDQGVDFQYQYLTDPHVITTQWSLIHERVNWDPAAGANNTSDNLDSLQGKVSYWYQRKYGLTLGMFKTSGSTDAAIYTKAATSGGVPDTRGYIVELDYMLQPWWRLGLQYTGYNKYLGTSSNYDGNGRNARDNNITYLYTWLAF